MTKSALRTLTEALATATLLAACGGPASPPDTTAPELTAAFPPDGYHGFTHDDVVRLEFSEPMDPASVEGAFALRGPGGVTIATDFTWEDENRRLLVRPRVPLAYSNDASYVNFTWSLGTEARDPAGNALDRPYQATFSTLRKLTTTLPPETIDGMVFSDNMHLTYPDRAYTWVGDRDTNQCAYSYLSFDLTQLPADAVAVGDVRFFAYALSVTGDPYALGALTLEHVDYGDALDGGDFELQPLAGANASLRVSQSWTSDWFVVPFLGGWLEQDIEAGRRHFQLRYRMENCTNHDGQHDFLNLATAEDTAGHAPYVEVDYYAP